MSFNRTYYTPGWFSVPALFVFMLTFSVFSSARTLIFESDQPVSDSNNPSSGASTVQKQTTAPAVPTNVGNQSSANSELFFMIEELQAQIKSLKGLLEEQSNEIRHLKRNAKARYLDLDSRILNLSKKSVKPAVVDETGSLVESTSEQKIADVDEETISSQQGNAKPAKASSEAEKAAYNDAYASIKAKRFDEAVSKFYAFIEKYPDGVLAGNAYYWLGEVYLVQPKLEQARQAFSIVVQAYPDHSKVADSLFKLGVAYDRLQNPTESQKYLTEVQKRFPNSTAAKLAKSYKINR